MNYRSQKIKERNDEVKTLKAATGRTLQVLNAAKVCQPDYVCFVLCLYNILLLVIEGNGGDCGFASQKELTDYLQEADTLSQSTEERSLTIVRLNDELTRVSNEMQVADDYIICMM